MSSHSQTGAAATVVITTKNRKDMLRTAVESALSQSVQLEVLVIDDGSTDDSSGMIRREFPQVILHRFVRSEGLIVQRTRAARLASTPIIFSLDDDATFSSATIVETTLTEFDHPRVGAVAIPFIDVNRDRGTQQRAPASDSVYVTRSYQGVAHAIRRDLFLHLGGYRAYLFHQGEEQELCIRMLDAGFVTRLGTSDPIHHFESPLRDRTRMDIYGPRNQILFAWYNVPAPYHIAHMLGASAKSLRHSLDKRHRHPERVVWGVLRGLAACLRVRAERNPVSQETYRIVRMLGRSKSLPLSEIEHLLPTPTFATKPVSR